MTLWQNIVTKKIDYLLVFALAFLEFGWIHWNTGVGDPDAYYHAAMARFLEQGVVLQSLPWMQFSTLTQNFTDHHFLYHVFLVPFLRLGDPLLALKVATVFFSACLLTTIYWFLKNRGNRYALIFTVLLMFSGSMLFRLALVKAVSFSLIILLLYIYSLVTRKKLMTFLLSAFYVLSYGGWILSIVVAGIYWVLNLIIKQKRYFWQFWKPKDVPTAQLFGLTLLGCACGLMIHPNWPQNLYFYYQQVILIGLINYGSFLKVGGEWYALKLEGVFSVHSLALIPLAFVIALKPKSIKSWSAEQWLYIIFALILFLMTYKSRRYLELSVPLTMIASAMAFQHAFPNLSWKGLKKIITTSRIVKIYTVVMALFIIPIIGTFFIGGLIRVQSYIKSGMRIGFFQSEAQWLKNNAEPQAVVLHSDWDEWPMLFYYNPNNYYIVGLDPTFMYNYNANLYNIYTAFSTAMEVSDAKGIVVNSLQSQYVVANNDHPWLQKMLDKNMDFRQVFVGPEAKIYKVQE